MAELKTVIESLQANGMTQAEIANHLEQLLKPKEVTKADVKPKFVITAERDTLIKASVNGSKYLKDDEKTAVPSGKAIGVAECKRDRDQHFWIKLPNGKEGFIYGPHWDLGKAEEPTPAPNVAASKMNEKGQLAVPYYNQRDNWEKYQGPGWRQCNLTSCAMAIEYLKPGYLKNIVKAKGYHEPEDAYGEILAKYGDTTDHAAQTEAMKSIGINSYFSYSASLKDLLLSFDKGVPVVMGVAYKSSGHMICGVGYNSRGVWIHDPYGIRQGMSDAYSNESGKYDFVTYDWIQAKWLDMGGEAGWGRFFTSVDGKATGIPSGL